MTLTPLYSERLGVPLRWWVQGTMFVATLWLAVIVALGGRAVFVESTNPDVKRLTDLVGSALVAAGEEVSLASTPIN